MPSQEIVRVQTQVDLWCIIFLMGWKVIDMKPFDILKYTKLNQFNFCRVVQAHSQLSWGGVPSLVPILRLRLFKFVLIWFNLQKAVLLKYTFSLPEGLQITMVLKLRILEQNSAKLATSPLLHLPQL